MTSVLSWSEILTLLTSGLILGGSLGMIVGLVINELNLSYKQPMAIYGLLGAVGYWAGIYISAGLWQMVTGNGAVVRIYLLVAWVGSVAMTWIGSVGMTVVKRGRKIAQAE